MPERGIPFEWRDGDDIDRAKAREHAKAILDDPKHQRPKGHHDDELTADDALDDPAHNEKGDE